MYFNSKKKMLKREDAVVGDMKGNLCSSRRKKGIARLEVLVLSARGDSVLLEGLVFWRGGGGYVGWEGLRLWVL